MKIITLPRLRLAQLQNLTENVLRITKPLKEVASQVREVEKAFVPFQEGMIKNEALSNKKTLDRQRDHMLSGLFNSIQAEQYFPHVSKQAQDALERVVAITNRYGTRINRLPYNEQSAETDNLLTELEAIDLSGLNTIARWLKPIKAANKTFKQNAGDYLELEVEASGIASATATAPILEDALKNLFTMLFAHRQIAGTDALDKAYKELTTLVATYP